MTTVDMIIDYLINNFMISFVMCLLGSLIKDMFDNMQNSSKLSIKKIFISTIFSSFLAASLVDWLRIKISFGAMLLICLLVGMWGFWILKWITKYANVYLLFSNVLKNVNNNIANGVANTMDETKQDSINDNLEIDDSHINKKSDKQGE